MTDIDLERKSFSENYDLYKNGTKTYILKRKPWSENYDIYDLQGNLYREDGLAFELKRKPWSNKYDLYKGEELFTGIIGAEEEEWLPTNIGGCVLWLRSDLAWQDAAKTVPCTANGHLIWTGEDKSLDNDVVQATEAKRPIYWTNQINGHSVWRFDGIDDFLKAVAFTWNDPEVIYIVFKPISWISGGRIFDGNTGNSMGFFQYDAEPEHTMYPSNEFGSLNISCTTGQAVIVRVKFNGASKGLRKNNEAEVDLTGSATNAGGFILGAMQDGASYTNIDFIEMFGYNAMPSAEEDVSAMAYLNVRYAIY